MESPRPNPGDLVFANWSLQFVSPPATAEKDYGIYSSYLHDNLHPAILDDLQASPFTTLFDVTLNFIKEHMRVLKLHKCVYMITDGLVDRMQGPHAPQHPIAALATSVAQTFGCRIFLYYSNVKNQYRLGQVLDQADRNSCANMAYLDVFNSDTADGAYLQAGGRRPKLLTDHEEALYATQRATYEAQASAAHATARTVAAGARAVEFAAFLAAQPATEWSLATEYGDRKEAKADGCTIVLEEKIPKPKNSWIIYRLANYQRVKRQNQGKNLKTADISKLLSVEWKQLPSYERQLWVQKADEEKFNHQLKYPGYKCKPRKSSQIKRRQAKTHGFKFQSATAAADDQFMVADNDDNYFGDLLSTPTYGDLLAIPNNDDLLSGIPFGNDDLLNFNFNI
nr:MAT1-1-3 [Drepanopeziza brunnea f. sp. 'monogermtubi']